MAENVYHFMLAQVIGKVLHELEESTTCFREMTMKLHTSQEWHVKGLDSRIRLASPGCSWGCNFALLAVAVTLILDSEF